MEQDKLHLQSRLVNGLRFPLIVLVVFIHALPKKLQTIYALDFSSQNFYSYISEIISHTIGNIAVPCFFLFSGFYALFNKWGGVNVKNLIKGVALPFFLWNAIYIILKLLRTLILSKLGSDVEEPFYLSSISLDLFWGNSAVYPLWYLRDLICMSLCIPIFYYLSKHVKYWVIILIPLYLINLSIPISGFSITAITFFGLGAYFATHKISLLSIAEKGRLLFIPVSILGIILLPLLIRLPYYENLSAIFVLSAVFGLLYFTSKLVRFSFWQRLENLSKAVFFIYAIHTIFIINWIKSFIANSMFIQEHFGKLFIYFLTGGATVLVSYIIYRISKALFPKISAILVGGRI